MCLAPTSELNILQLLLVHAEIMPELVDDREADLIPDFGLGGAHRFDVLLVEDDVVRPGGRLKMLFLVMGTP